MVDSPRPTVLVVDDKRSLADLYARFLEETYETYTAYDGEQALRKLNDEVDVVLLDRRMPGPSGQDVLAEIRDRGHSCRVAMVTAVNPDVDIVEMGFDDYLTKPVDRSDLRDTVDRLLELDDYDVALQEYYRLVSKKAALEAEKGDTYLESSDEYSELKGSIDELEAELETKRDTIDDADIRAVLRRTDHRSGG